MSLLTIAKCSASVQASKNNHVHLALKRTRHLVFTVNRNVIHTTCLIWCLCFPQLQIWKTQLADAYWEGKLKATYSAFFEKALLQTTTAIFRVDKYVRIEKITSEGYWSLVKVIILFSTWSWQTPDMNAQSKSCACSLSFWPHSPSSTALFLWTVVTTFLKNRQLRNAPMQAGSTANFPPSTCKSCTFMDSTSLTVEPIHCMQYVDCLPVVYGNESTTSLTAQTVGIVVVHAGLCIPWSSFSRIIDIAFNSEAGNICPISHILDKFLFTLPVKVV